LTRLDPYSALRVPLAVLDSGLESSRLKALDQANTGFMVSAEIGGLPPFSQALRVPPLSRLMSTSSHDFVTVNMRGLKAVLVACASERRVSVSAFVRKAVEIEVGRCADKKGLSDQDDGDSDGDAWVKVSLRMRRREASRMDAGARAAGLSRGAYLAGLVDGIPVLASGGGRPAHISALTTSCAELSTLSRNVHQLTALLRAGNVQQALLYRDMLDRLADEVRAHLGVAAQVVMELRPSRRTASVSGGSLQAKRRRPWNEA
jgi:hypothetical protein